MSDSPFVPTFDSINEANMYRVMSERSGIQWYYQYPINGGRFVKGGQVIDFVITDPMMIAMYLGHGEGGYWHGGARDMDDKLKQDAARKEGFEVYLFTNDETATYEAARASYMQKVGI